MTISAGFKVLREAVRIVRCAPFPATAETGEPFPRSP